MSSYGKIGSELKALNNTSWIATAYVPLWYFKAHEYVLIACVLARYFLTLTSFQPLYGKLSDIFGRKSALLFGYAIFGIGCLFCGLARNMNELIAARVSGPFGSDGGKWTDSDHQAFAGIGGGGMTTVVSIMMSDIVPLRERGTWQGIINIIYASGAGIGAPLGKFIVSPCLITGILTGWQVVFLLTTSDGGGHF